MNQHIFRDAGSVHTHLIADHQFTPRDGLYRWEQATTEEMLAIHYELHRLKQLADS